MKSNDNIPADELLLAEAIAAAKARGMEWCSGTMFVDRYGFHTSDGDRVPRDARGCCALGALRIARREKQLPKDFCDSVTFGNDYERWLSTDKTENPDWFESHSDDGESLGYAYRCAMENP